jgi:hypothetical protein
MTTTILAGLWGTYQHVKGGGDAGDKAGRLVECFIGVNPNQGASMKFQWQQMKFTLPVAGGVVAKKALGYLGAGRYFRGLPFTL